jgi:hypothetical protein
MKMGKKDPRSSMSKSTKAVLAKKTGRNPIQSPGPYETPGVGEDCAPKGSSLKKAAPEAEPVADESTDSELED